MRYKNKNIKLLNVICALFIFLLMSSTANAQKVNVSEKTPEQLISSANRLLEHTGINVKFSSPILNDKYKRTTDSNEYISYFEYKETSTNKKPLTVILLTNKNGIVSEINLIQGNAVTGNEISTCLSPLYLSLGLTVTEISTMLRSAKTFNGAGYGTMSYDIYSPRMKRRFITHSTILNNSLFTVIMAEDK